MKKTLLTLLFAVAGATALQAQHFAYRADFSFFFDNLENSVPWEPTRTYLAAALRPEVGVVFDKHHSFMVGANLIQNMGDSARLTQTDIIAYYRYRSRNFNGFAGALPRDYSIAHYPNSFFRDDLYFYRPVIQGVLLQYLNRKKTGYVEFFLDWYGLNNELRIDEFMLCASTEYAFLDRLLLIGANGQLTHYKNDYKLQDSYLLERAYYNLYVGTDLTSVLPALQEARISFGLLSSMEHKRVLDTETSWRHAPGAQLDIAFRWKGLGLSNSFYFGDKQHFYYQQYGGDLYWGSPFYQSGRYNRTDISYLWKNRFFRIKADMAFHYDGRKLSTQQLLTLGVRLHQMLVRGRAVHID